MRELSSVSIHKRLLVPSVTVAVRHCVQQKRNDCSSGFPESCLRKQEVEAVRPLVPVPAGGGCGVGKVRSLCEPQLPHPHGGGHTLRWGPQSLRRQACG